ncbi:MAG: ribosome recycling factor [Candidatus Glassbacteria bacterium]|nr:ribosome recycling factor [Candidatus Glassbacteria bacterium]
MDKVLKPATEKMERSVAGIRHELTGIRTGKASPGLLETIQVEAYESKMPLNQLSTISSPEPRLLVVQPWDKTLIGAISKAIQSSDLGLTPSSDGNVIRVPIPPLNEERRKDLVRLVHKIVETGRVSIRHARKDANDELKQMQKDGKLSEDQEHQGFDEVQKLTDQYIEKMDELLGIKEEEIMEI